MCARDDMQGHCSRAGPGESWPPRDRRWAFGPPPGCWLPCGWETLSPASLGSRGGRNSDRHHLLPPGRGASAQETCQGEEAVCPGRNVGGCGGSVTGIPGGGGDTQCLSSSLGSSVSACRRTCGTQARGRLSAARLLPSKPQLPRGQAVMPPFASPVLTELPPSPCRRTGFCPALGGQVSRVLSAPHGTHSPGQPWLPRPQLPRLDS